MIEKIVEWSNIARKQGLLGLESAVEQEQDEFLKKGLQSLVDGGEPEAIRSSMEIELDTMEHFDTQAAKVFEAMGVYSPDARHHRRRHGTHGGDAESRGSRRSSGMASRPPSSPQFTASLSPISCSCPWATS
jgi:hypothetical protein